MSVRFILTCGKTGRYWQYRTSGQAQQAARSLGLKEYDIKEVLNGFEPE